MPLDQQPTAQPRLRVLASSATRGATSATQKAVVALVRAVGDLVDAAVARVLLTDERVTSAEQAQRILAGEEDTEALADKIQRVVVLAVPVVRMLARGARFTRLPWVMLVSSSASTAIAVRSGVRELQVLASLVAYRVERATGAPSDPALVKKVAIDLYLKPKGEPDLSDDSLRLVRLTRTWLLRGALGRNTASRAAKALAAAERLDGADLSTRWQSVVRGREPSCSSSCREAQPTGRPAAGHGASSEKPR
jgi:hypothetical protein